MHDHVNECATVCMITSYQLVIMEMENLSFKDWLFDLNDLIIITFLQIIFFFKEKSVHVPERHFQCEIILSLAHLCYKAGNTMDVTLCVLLATIQSAHNSDHE